MHILLKTLLQEAIIDNNPNFKKWFANSKVVDSGGNPLRVYHGTSKDKDFSKFTSKQNGMWFTSSPESASSYANQNDSMKTTMDIGPGGKYIFKNINTASRVIPVYLSIQNPAKLDKDSEYSNKLKHSQNYSKAQREVFNELKSKGYDGADFGDGIYVVFDPRQIKSAIGNNGDFNPNNPDIGK